MKKLLAVVALVAASLTLVAPQPAYALTMPDKGGINELSGADTDLTTQIYKFINVALWLVGLIAFLIFLYGGFMYLTAAGNAENTQKGVKAMGYAIVGIVIIFLAYAITNFVIRGAETGQGGSSGSSSSGGL